MLKISKLADYGTTLLLIMAEHPEQIYTASQLSEITSISIHTVSKLLKLLLKKKLLVSQRGSQGGYHLNKPPQNISMAEIVTALDGDIAMTECVNHVGTCTVEKKCGLKNHWSMISRSIENILKEISLQSMLAPMNYQESPVKFYKKVLP
jgi:FeS assembly SUF system regulator